MENRDTSRDIALASHLHLTGDLSLPGDLNSTDDLTAICPWSKAADEPTLPSVGQHRPFASLVLPTVLLFGKTFCNSLARSLSFAALAITFWPRDIIDSHQWHRARARERRIFESMDDCMLKDIGLTRSDLYEDLYRRPPHRTR